MSQLLAAWLVPLLNAGAAADDFPESPDTRIGAHWDHEPLRRSVGRDSIEPSNLMRPGESGLDGVSPYRWGSFLERLTVLQGQLAKDPTNIVTLFKLGDLCHDEGARNNHKAVVLAENYLEQVLALDDRHAMALVLLGSTYTMKGRDAFWPNTRIALVKEGNRKMDAAVHLAPEDPQVRLTRALNNFHMPKWLGREALVQADFAWLWGKMGVKPAPFENAVKQDVALHYGLVLKRQKQVDEAAAVWQAGLEFEPDSALARQIREELNKIRRR